MHLSSLPLTPSGKLDRRALPPPEDEAFARQQFEAPEGEIGCLPSTVKIHLFKAADDKCMKKMPQTLGWENYNSSSDLELIHVDGDHRTMLTDPKNRNQLGKKLTK